jgi:hypothetical protein
MQPTGAGRDGSSSHLPSRAISVSLFGSLNPRSTAPIERVKMEQIGKGTTWVFRADNLDETFQVLSDRGVKFVSPPKPLPWGRQAKSATKADPLYIRFVGGFPEIGWRLQRSCKPWSWPRRGKPLHIRWKQ